MKEEIRSKAVAADTEARKKEFTEKGQEDEKVK